MPTQVEALEQGYRISGTLDRETVVGFWPDRVQALSKAQQDGRVVLDLSDLSRVDSAGLAFLLQLVALLKQNDIRIVFKGIPENLANLAKLSDVDTLLPLQ
ncbi:STAS domain-containing protein [Aestuariibacter halophilus]|uniref:STAS domain-containing protein n=1 Tax=Fluctibacter halophilus TaxID=226011 RepID=A0ABS8GB94_9ALTE|nr:STAS domain-containing protein [Aestuariibacter halophilus]MCC2617840.1 STAS domain-containing protein [Aestuariibacter halophilus]